MRSAATALARRGAWLLLAGGLLAAAGCATKKDVRTLQWQLAAMQVRQDSALQVLQRESRILLDSVRKAMNITQDASGQTSHRFQQLEQTLAQTQDLVAQIMQSAQDLSTRLDNFSAQQPGPLRPGAGVGEAGGGTAEEYYALGTEKLGEAAYSTARAAFQQLLKEFPDHERAPDAQFEIGQTYAAEKDYARAVQELQIVAEQWPNSERAPEALYRAGVIAADSVKPKQPRQARQLLERVVGTFPNATVASRARTKLRSLPRS
ncbi:MAG: outer membrane protein assembly factor BamD [Gemmatimonadetes bacterium]|nr:outer membrane protein assembly factor BamD [Gemmatimonadota bacterium]